LLLKERGGARLAISKVVEGDDPSPDFECVLQIDQSHREHRELKFYVEVKTLDIVDAKQRLPEILDEGMETQIEIDRQQRQGKRIAIAEQVIAPLQRFDGQVGYDPRSVRLVIETLIGKAAGNFKSAQFRCGPTFALANLLRLPLPGQGASALAPFFYDTAHGGACVSGVLWNMAFGQLDAPIHRWPEFEGAGTLDGNLQSAGVLVDRALGLPAAGLILFYYDRGSYRFDGLYDSKREDKVHTWSNLETEEVYAVLCGDVNDRRNSMSHKYALYRDRPISP
jgi:hypothetical protein